VRFHLTRFATAFRYALIEQVHNRFAMTLIVLFVPFWTALTYLAMPATRVPMQLRATGEEVAPPANELTAISGALNGVTLITGFMMFAATLADKAFDRRLVMVGYPRIHLALAKLTTLALASTAIAAYVTWLSHLAWSPRQSLLFIVALLCAGLTYGALGVSLGSVLGREVEGMFAIAMLSIIDLALQSPILGSDTDNPVIRYLPSYGAMQASTAAVFSTGSATRYVVIQLAWFAGAVLVALVSFDRSTRGALPANAVRGHGFTARERPAEPVHRQT
jgi:hypothetical protein